MNKKMKTLKWKIIWPKIKQKTEVQCYERQNKLVKFSKTQIIFKY